MHCVDVELGNEDLGNEEYFSFVLTGSDGYHTFGACLMFGEALTREEQEQDALDRDDRRRSGGGCNPPGRRPSALLGAAEAAPSGGPVVAPPLQWG